VTRLAAAKASSGCRLVADTEVRLRKLRRKKSTRMAAGGGMGGMGEWAIWGCKKIGSDGTDFKSVPLSVFDRNRSPARVILCGVFYFQREFISSPGRRGRVGWAFKSAGTLFGVLRHVVQLTGRGIETPSMTVESRERCSYAYIGVKLPMRGRSWLVIHFDLNDIENEPSDEALASLMEAVAEEVRRKELVRRQQLKESSKKP